MKNKELKELWKNDKNSLRDIEKILLTRPHKFCRGRSGNVDLVLTFVPKQIEDDDDLFVTVGGIYATDELDCNIIISRNGNGEIKFLIKK